MIDWGKYGVKTSHESNIDWEKYKKREEPINPSLPSGTIVGPYNTQEELDKYIEQSRHQRMGRDIPVIGNVLGGLDVVGEKVEPFASFARSLYTPGAGLGPVQAAYRGVGGLLSRRAPQLGNTLRGRVLEEAIKEGAVSVPVAAGQTLASGETDLKEVAKQGAIGGGLGLVTGSAFGAVRPLLDRRAAGKELQRLIRDTELETPFNRTTNALGPRIPEQQLIELPSPVVETTTQNNLRRIEDFKPAERAFIRASLEQEPLSQRAAAQNLERIGIDPQEVMQRYDQLEIPLQQTGTESIRPSRRATDFPAEGSTLSQRQSKTDILGEYGVKREELNRLIKEGASDSVISNKLREMQEAAQSMSGDKLAKSLYLNPPRMSVVNGRKVINADDFTPDRVNAAIDFALDHSNIDWRTAKDQTLLTGNFKTLHGLINNLFRESTLKSDPRNLVKRIAIDSFDDAKRELHKHTEIIASELRENLARFGITKNSRESAMAMALGEGKISLEEVRRQFPTKWQNIVNAKDFARQYYDDMIDMQNEVLRKIYANSPDIEKKLIPKRKDYFRHIQEENAKFKDITDLLDTAAGIRNVEGGARAMARAFKNLGRRIKDRTIGRPIQIDPELVGVSEHTNPKSKWNPLKKQRLTDDTDFDLMAGLMDYTNHATYQMYVSPYIQVLDALTKGIARRADKGNLNNYIEILNSFKQILQGKTSWVDRWPQKIIGREAMRGLDAINTRVRKNSILMSTSAAWAQLTHIPNAIANSSTRAFNRGMRDYFKYLMSNGADNPIKKSSFMQERYLTNNLMRQFETRLINKATDKAGKISLEVIDKMAGEMTWHTMYRRALEEGVENPIRRADDLTRDILGARGKGEKSVFMSARTTNFIIPFQLEVANNTRIMADLLKHRQFKNFSKLMVANFIFNGLGTYLVGRKLMYDPIKSMIEAYKVTQEEDNNTQKVFKILGRLAGELLSSIPVGQQIASTAFPNEGTRKRYFGDADPARYGTDLLMTDVVKDPLFKFVTPFGGTQLKRTLQGAKSLLEGGYYGPNLVSDITDRITGKEIEDRLRFPLERTPENVTRALAGGIWSTKEGKEYLEQNQRPLSAKQTEEFKQSQRSPQDEFKLLLLDREIDDIDRMLSELNRSDKSPDQKNKERLELMRKRKELVDERVKVFNR